MSQEPDNFSWLTKARASNQDVLLRLYRNVKPSDEPQSSPRSRSIFTLLVGAGFSLWRAAFLSDVTRESSKITEDAAKLLKRLIQDNSVAYPQDRDTREWMAGYYINNAIWRLLMAWQFMEEEQQKPMPTALHKLKEFNDRGLEHESPIELWNHSHEALIALVTLFEKMNQHE